MSLVMYGLKNCSTCVKAQKWLAARGMACQFIDYRDQPVAEALLLAWGQQLGGLEKLVNRASTGWRGLTDEQKASVVPQEWLALIAATPTLIKRPVLVLENKQINLGFSEKKYDELFA